MKKTSKAVVRPLSKPNSDDPLSLVASVAPRPSAVSSPRGPTQLQHRLTVNGRSLVGASLALLWIISVATLTRFCLMELSALKKEIFLARDDSTTSSLAARHDDDGGGGSGDDGPPAVVNRNLGALFGFFQDQEESSPYDDDDDNGSHGYDTYNYDDDDYQTDHTDDDDSRIYDDDSRYSSPEDDDSNDDGSVLLPRLILHVGPSKSATTTLQTDLTAAYDAGWLKSEYAGRFYRPFYHNSTAALMLNRSESPLLVAARQMLHANHCPQPEPSCCTAFRKELDAYYYQQQNNNNTNTDNQGQNNNNRMTTVILSDEAFGNMWTDPAHFAAIHQTLARHWNLTVVVGYRHFYEWILSSKYQRDRTDRISNQGKVQWPGPGPEGGRALLPLFPDTLSNWRQWFHYTDSIVYNAKHGSIDDVRILDLHAAAAATAEPATSSSSILTQFLCTAHLDEDCATSRRVDLQKSGAPMTVMNSQADTTVPSLYYDAVATQAAEQQLIDTTVHGRRHVREAVRAFHEDTHGLAPHDLALHCPTAMELTKLLEYSLQMERAFFVVPDQQAHVDGFWSKARANAFCWVNATAVLNSQHWRDFFAEHYLSGY